MRRRAGRVTASVLAAGLGCLTAGGVLVARDAGRDPVARVTEVGDVPPATEASPPPAPRAMPEPAPTAGSEPAAASVPAELRLAGTSAAVVPVGVGPGGSLALPASPDEVGWWTSGALAGAPHGSTLVAGHVDAAGTGPGAMAALRDLQVGDLVALRGADGTEHRYRVESRRSYPKTDLPADLFRTDGPPRLVLVTCGGRFDRATGHYDDNVVVHAVPTPD